MSFISTRLNKSASVIHIAIGWLCYQSHHHLAILGSRSIEQLKVNIEATNWKISEKEMNEVDNIIHKSGLWKKIKSSPDTFLEK